jgi:hypothetical protein
MERAKEGMAYQGNGGIEGDMGISAATEPISYQRPAKKTRSPQGLNADI